MCGIACGVSTAVLGTALLLSSTIVGYGLLDGIINGMIAGEVSLADGSLNLERFIDVPFAMNFSVRAFNLTNPDAVANGAIPIVEEVGPYIYKLYQTREIMESDEDTLTYRLRERFEFDTEGSFPYSEDDIITTANVPYNAILQVVEVEYPELLGLLGLALGGVFGPLNSPVASMRAGSLFLDGLPLCASPGLAGGVACSQIRSLAGDNRNMDVQPDGSISFSIFGYKNTLPSANYKVYRGLADARDVGRIISYDNSYRLRLWPEGDDGSLDEHEPNICNSLRGTDTGIFPPFLERDRPIYAFNADICRSVELHYESSFGLRGVQVRRYGANEWFLDNHEGCFCLNLTRGLTGPDGCLLTGAQELYSCVGGFLVLSNPHFLFADPIYRNGVIGMTPNEDIHRIWMDLEPNTGVVIRGAARVQFNMFLRPIPQISATNNLPNVLLPLFWLEQGMELPDEFLEEMNDKLLAPLRLVDILVPVLVATSCVLLVVGGVVATRAGLKRKASKNNK
ncbi:sensory neuron membrane protein 2 isoform X1 [Leguminivora glycinivorella]|uniref:sensory neuron membrane protein 2 isoform X1 n=1 Tax=Leguminivora glycinivorella TaxID=1035111 RepID=UPI0020105BA6|nr:sensory neuron membrane protein 2 isoform X1 [Leguminivora glycinivorella]